MATIGTRLFTRLHGKIVGQDSLGNVYYTEKREPKGRRAKRWVIYAGSAEPSRVPPGWHGWLHYSTDVSPTEQLPPHYGWQKAPQENLSGTTAAYLPPGHLMKGGKRDAAAADYEPWKP